MRAWCMASILFFCSDALAYQQVLTETGEVVAWPTHDVRFTVDDGFPMQWNGEDVESVVLAAKNPWESLECSSLTLAYEGWTSGGQPDLFDTHNGVYWIQDDWQFGSALMAITLLEFSKFTGELRDADILVNNNQKTFDLDSTCDNEGLNFDLQNILTHEFGRFVGLNHSDNAAATMFADTFEADCGKRELHPDDEAGFCATYNREDPVDSEVAETRGAEPEEEPAEGCHSGRNVTFLPLLLLLVCVPMARPKRALSGVHSVGRR